LKQTSFSGVDLIPEMWIHFPELLDLIHRTAGSFRPKYTFNWSNVAVDPARLQLTIHAPNFNFLASGSRLKNKRSKNEVAAPEAEA